MRRIIVAFSALFLAIRETRAGVLQSLLGSAKSGLQSLFGSAVVYACRDTYCGGTGWMPTVSFCNTGGPCSGRYATVTYDGSSHDGFAQVIQHCGTTHGCGC